MAHGSPGNRLGMVQFYSRYMHVSGCISGSAYQEELMRHRGWLWGIGLGLIFGCGGSGSDGGFTDGGGSDAVTSGSCESTSSNGGLNRCDNTCRRPGGIICNTGFGMDRCPADDGVNDCDCYPNAGIWACTQVGVPIGGPGVQRCLSHSDCTRATKGVCIFDHDPRETRGRCRYR